MAKSQHRFLLALPRGGGKVFLSWRLLASDAPDAPFLVERRDGGAGSEPGGAPAHFAWQRITTAPIQEGTSFLDQAPTPGTWAYRVVTAEGIPSEAVEVDAGAPPSMLALDCPIDPDDVIEGLVVGDLTHDGRMGFVLRAARAGTVWFTAYRYDGKTLWELDTRLSAVGGWDGGMNHVPFLCWDIIGDGRTEFVTHRFQGTFPAHSYDTAGPDEFLTALDAETGEQVWDAPWPAVKSRVMMTAGHLHGVDRPAAIVVQDETYQDITLTAVDGKTGRTHWRNLTDGQRKNFVPVHWDAGPEVVFIVRKENRRIVRMKEAGEIEELPEAKLSEGGQYGRNLACVDVIGDYRENIITVDTERHRLMVLANATVSPRRGYSPTDQFDYRHDRSQLGSGYYIYLSPPDTAVGSR